MKKKTTLIYILVLLFILSITDRYLWMPKELSTIGDGKVVFYLGDPISYEYDFKISGSSIIFKKEKAKNEFENVNRSKNRSYYFLDAI